MHPTALLTSIQLSLNTFTFGKVKQQKQRNKTKTKIALSRIFFFFFFWSLCPAQESYFKSFILHSLLASLTVHFCLLVRFFKKSNSKMECRGTQACREDKSRCGLIVLDNYINTAIYNYINRMKWYRFFIVSVLYSLSNPVKILRNPKKLKGKPNSFIQSPDDRNYN